MVYLDNEYPSKGEDYPDDYFIVGYNEEKQYYDCGGFRKLNAIAAPTLQETIEQGIAAFDTLLVEKRRKSKP